MSKLVAVRLPDDVMARIVASGRGVTASLVDAARQYFALVEVKQAEKLESKKKPAAKRSKPVAVPDALTVALEEAAAGAVEPVVVSGVVVPVAVSEKPKNLAACSECGSIGGHQRWCSKRPKK